MLVLLGPVLGVAQRTDANDPSIPFREFEVRRDETYDLDDRS